MADSAPMTRLSQNHLADTLRVSLWFPRFNRRIDMKMFMRTTVAVLALCFLMAPLQVSAGIYGTYKWEDFDGWDNWGLPEDVTFRFGTSSWLWHFYSTGFTEPNKMQDSETETFNYEGAYVGETRRLRRTGPGRLDYVWEGNWDVKGRARVTYTPMSYTDSDGPTVGIKVFNVKRFSSNNRWTNMPGIEVTEIPVTSHGDATNFTHQVWWPLGEYVVIDGSFFGEDGEWVAASVSYHGVRTTRRGVDKLFSTFGGLAAELQDD